MYKIEIKKKLIKLYKLALDVYDNNPELSRRYIFLLLRIKRKFRYPLPKELRNKFCKRCYTVWIPGKTLSIRIRRGKIIYRCLNCGYVKRLQMR